MDKNVAGFKEGPIRLKERPAFVLDPESSLPLGSVLVTRPESSCGQRRSSQLPDMPEGTTSGGGVGGGSQAA